MTRTRSIVAAAFALGITAGLLAAPLLPKGPWHTIVNTCPSGAVVSYSGAGQDGEIMFSGPGACIEVWKR